MPEGDKTYVRFRGRTVGPLSEKKVKDLIRRGQITRAHELSADGTDWRKAEDYRDYFRRPTATSETPQLAARSSTIASSQSAGSVDQAASNDVAVQDQPSVWAEAIPGAPVEPTVQWYVRIDNESRGPLSIQQVQGLTDQGRLSESTLVWRSGLDSWQPAASVLPSLFGAQPDRAEATAERAASSGFQSQDVGVREDSITSVVRELNRRRKWLTFFACFLIVTSGLNIFVVTVSLFVVASRPISPDQLVGRIVGAAFYVVWMGVFLSAGVMLLRYVAAIKRLAGNPSHAGTMSSLRQLSSFWIFAGIASLVFTTLVAGLFLLILLFALVASESNF